MPEFPAIFVMDFQEFKYKNIQEISLNFFASFHENSKKKQQ